MRTNQHLVQTEPRQVIHKLSRIQRSEDQTMGVSRETCTLQAKERLFHVEQPDSMELEHCFT